MPHAHMACRNKRCIPKEGIPHALRACQKKRVEKITHILKEKEKKREGRDGS